MIAPMLYYSRMRKMMQIALSLHVFSMLLISSTPLPKDLASRFERHVYVLNVKHLVATQHHIIQTIRIRELDREDHEKWDTVIKLHQEAAEQHLKDIIDYEKSIGFDLKEAFK